MRGFLLIELKLTRRVDLAINYPTDYHCSPSDLACSRYYIKTQTSVRIGCVILYGEETFTKYVHLKLQSQI